MALRQEGLSVSRAGRGPRLVAALPDSLRNIEVWPRVPGRLVVGGGRGQLVIDEAHMRRLPVPVSWLSKPAGLKQDDLTTWRLPRVVVGLDVRADALAIRARAR